MRQALHHLTFQTQGRGLVEITREVARWVGDQQIATGLLTIFCRHTSASLLIQENADPDVRTDLEAFFERSHRKRLGSTSTRTKARTTCRRTCVAC